MILITGHLNMTILLGSASQLTLQDRSGNQQRISRYNGSLASKMAKSELMSPDDCHLKNSFKLLTHMIY